MGYREEFVVRDDGTTAYRCFLLIAARRLSITPGLPAATHEPLLAAQ